MSAGYRSGNVFGGKGRLSVFLMHALRYPSIPVLLSDAACVGSSLVEVGSVQRLQSLLAALSSVSLYPQIPTINQRACQALVTKLAGDNLVARQIRLQRSVLAYFASTLFAHPAD